MGIMSQLADCKQGEDDSKLILFFKHERNSSSMTLNLVVFTIPWCFSHHMMYNQARTVDLTFFLPIVKALCRV